MKIINLVTQFKKAEDCLVTPTGIEIINVHQMISEQKPPPSTPCILVTVKHWFFIERQYLVHPIMWMTTGSAIRIPKEGMKVKVADGFVRPDNSMFYKKLSTYMTDYAKRMITEIHLNSQAEIPSAEIINLADRRGK